MKNTGKFREISQSEKVGTMLLEVLYLLYRNGFCFRKTYNIKFNLNCRYLFKTVMNVQLPFQADNMCLSVDEKAKVENSIINFIQICPNVSFIMNFLMKLHNS